MRYYGHIIRWNSSRGFGAIREEHSGNEIFAVSSAFEEEPQDILEGQKVSFTIGVDRRGRREAQDIRFTEDDWSDNFFKHTGRREPSRIGNLIMWLIALSALAVMVLLGLRYWQQHQMQAKRSAAQQTMVSEVAREIKEERRAWNKAAKSPRRRDAKCGRTSC